MLDAARCTQQAHLFAFIPRSPSTRLNPTNFVEKEKPPIIVGDGDWKPTTDDLSHSRSGVLILLYTSWQGLP